MLAVFLLLSFLFACLMGNEQAVDGAVKAVTSAAKVVAQGIQGAAKALVAATPRVVATVVAPFRATVTSCVQLVAFTRAAVNTAAASVKAVVASCVHDVALVCVNTTAIPTVFGVAFHGVNVAVTVARSNGVYQAAKVLGVSIGAPDARHPHVTRALDQGALVRLVAVIDPAPVGCAAKHLAARFRGIVSERRVHRRDLWPLARGEGIPPPNPFHSGSRPRKTDTGRTALKLRTVLP